MRFRDEVAIVIERYDRVHVEPQPLARERSARAPANVRRTHQEDICQALGYASLDQCWLKLAMKLGATYRVRDVAAHCVRELAAALRLDPEEEVARTAGQQRRWASKWARSVTRVWRTVSSMR